MGMPESLIANWRKIANERNMLGKWVYTTDKAVMIPFYNIVLIVN